MKAIGIAMIIVLWLCFTSAWADEKASKNVLDKSIIFYGGIQVYQADGEFGYVKDEYPDITIGMDDLGLDENAVSPVIGAVINFGRRWTLRFDYFGYHDNAKATADYEFYFDDIKFSAGASLKSNIDIDIYVANLSYKFIRTERVKLGVGVGVHAADLDVEVSGQAYAGPLKADLGTGEADLLAPLPNLYVMGAYSFTDRLIVRGEAGGMSLNYGDWSGSLFFYTAVVEYWPFRYAGLGAGYRYITADIEYEPGHKKETYDVDLPGPLFYAIVGF